MSNSSLKFFYKDGCANCDLMEPVFREFIATYPDISVLGIRSSEKTVDLINEYEITEFPTFVLETAGRKIAQGSGLFTMKDLQILFGL